jgi:hypothetical protein
VRRGQAAATLGFLAQATATRADLYRVAHVATHSDFRSADDRNVQAWMRRFEPGYGKADAIYPSRSPSFLPIRWREARGTLTT